MRVTNRLLITLFAIWVAAGCMSAEQNPITNGSFEVVNEAGAPVDWDVMGTVSVGTTEARSGERALHLVRGADSEGIIGLNRAWDEGSGEQGTMLSQRKGGIRFWYKAVSAAPDARLSVQVIPMNSRPRETGGGRVYWYVPRRHIGDGEWHEGEFAYDFSGNDNVQWVHVSARLHGAGEMWLDDFEWVAQVGPVMQPGAAEITEEPGQEGHKGALTWTLRNIGDAASAAGLAQITLPRGLEAESTEQEVPAIAAGETGEVTWEIIGRRDQAGEEISLSARCGDDEVVGSLTLQPEAQLTDLRAPRMLMRPGQQVVVRLFGRNDGNAIAESIVPELAVPASLQVRQLETGGELPPGAESEIASWVVTATESDLLARVRAEMDDGTQISVPLVVVDRLPHGVATRGGAYAFERGVQVVVGSDKSRLILGQADGAWGIGILQARTPGGWRTVALLPRMGLIATEQSETALSADHVTTQSGAETALAYLSGVTEIDGVEWRTRWTLTAMAGRPAIGYTLRAHPRQDASVTAFEGPMLYAGEIGARRRDDAVLPGLEWLVRGEKSSNALDIEPDHPDRIRYVPHPHKVSVPAAAMRFGNTAVGLLWDIPPHQPSYYDAGPMNVVFASPNRFEGHENHLLGLFLPGVGEGVEENERRAEEPMPVPAYERLKIHAGMFASSPVDDSMSALDFWFKHHGYPEPLAYPRGDVKGEISFSLRGYFKNRALWNPEWGKWYSDLIVGFRPDVGPARELLRGAQLLGDTAVAQKARDLAAEVMGGDRRSRLVALQHKASVGEIAGKRGTVRSYVSTQSPDGNWGFSGERAGEWPEQGVNYEFLGRAGEKAVGLTASKAAACLNFALLTGDRDAGRAGIRALRGMRKFTVPRAAQVWEVPVHTPDILASGRAVDAYLNGYELTGDESYLADAIYWARSGLPFVYIWSAHDQPAMQGASIPVFGATSYVLSWFGVAVQWNGVAYAEALLRLAEYDDSFPWERVAENPYRSAMYQQATEGERLGQWPDAVNFIKGRPGLHGSTPPCFKPSSVLRHEFRLMGVKIRPEVFVVARGARPLVLRGEATFSEVEWTSNVLSFAAEFTWPQKGAVEVIGVREPTRVILDGEVIERSDDLWGRNAAGWCWHEETDDLEIRIIHSGRHEIRVEGVRRAGPLVLKPRRVIDFTFDRGTEGWTAANDLAPLRIIDGAVHTENAGGDPYMVCGNLDVKGTAADVLAIRMSATAGGQGSVYFGTEEGGFSPERTMSLQYTPDGSWQEVEVAIGSHAGWAGHTITALRIDPMTGEETAQIRVDRVKLERRE